MRRSVRAAAVSGLGLLLLVFFLPLIPTRLAVDCGYACPQTAGGGPPTAYFSLGHLATGWGAMYAPWQGGYLPPSITLSSSTGSTTLSSWGVLFFVLYPAAVLGAVLLCPEIARSRAGGLGFAALGAFVASSSTVFLFTGIPVVGSMGTMLVATGGLMVAYGLGLRPFRREPFYPAR